MRRRIRLRPSEMSPDLLRAVHAFEQTYSTNVDHEMLDVTLVVGVFVKEVIIKQRVACAEDA